jgi:IS605 OrfB family transposase
MNQEFTFTYQTRIKPDSNGEMILEKFGELFGKVERKLFAKVSSGLHPNQLKNSFLKEYQITARQFNAIRVQLMGKIDSAKELLSLRISSLKETIDSLKRKISKLTGKKKSSTLHQKKRRLHRLESKRDKLEEDRKQGKIRLCFGSKKLFRAQFSLKENGYTTHQEWKKEWESSREGSFFILGSKDETAGNQSCVATVDKDQTLTLRVRLPRLFEEKWGKYLIFKNVHFNHGHENILEALKNTRQAISYRFHKDEKGWRIFASICKAQSPQESREFLGALGVDINADHLAVVEMDRFGNPLKKRTIPLNTYGKSKSQTTAIIGDAVKELVNWAASTCKPIILEKLDFKKKKSSLREEGFAKHSRMLSSFCYQKIFQMILSNAFRKNIAVHTVNPAYTSTIGHVKFSFRYGLSKHHAAALTIARRYFGFSENPTQPSSKMPDGKEGHLTLLLPERNRSKHVWSFWAVVIKKIRTALAAHFRTGEPRSEEPPNRRSSRPSEPDFAGEIPARESLAELLG